MFNSYTAYTIGPTEYLDKVFTYLPANAFINKGRCGIGGTTLEINNPYRYSIIVAPTVGILIDKKKAHPDLFIVYAKVTLEDVKEQLALKLPAQKIMCTAEGTRKVIEAATDLGMLDELYNNWFILLDECHTFITEEFRKSILCPFDYFWNFKSRSIITATPYFFTDERFSKLDYHAIKFTDTLGTINLLNCKSVAGSLTKILREHKNRDKKGKLHIFLNSVTEIVLAVKRAELELFHIHCADDKDKENMRKLGDLQDHYVEQPDKDNFSEVNFYTSRYFEGWDLYDPEATIIVVTDVNSPHTKVSVGLKLKQAVGRLRNPGNAKIIHITNVLHQYHAPKTLKALEAEYYRHARYHLQQYENYLNYCHDINKQPDKYPQLDVFADFEYKTKVAILNYTKLDQQINMAYSHQMYNTIELIKQEWEDGYYKVIVETRDDKLETKTTMKRKSKAQQLKDDYTELQASKGNSFYIGLTPEERIRATNLLAYQAFKLIDIERMEELKYNAITVQKEVIVRSNQTKQGKLQQLLAMTFKQGDNLVIEDIRKRLQVLYDRLDIRDPKSGKIRKAEATDLRNYGWFEIHPTKHDNGSKPKLNGFYIARVMFAVQIAA